MANPSTPRRAILFECRDEIFGARFVVCARIKAVGAVGRRHHMNNLQVIYLFPTILNTSNVHKPDCSDFRAVQIA